MAKTVSPSQLDAMGCRLAWHLGYKEGYRAMRSSEALELGTGIHAGLEYYYSGKGHPVEGFDIWAKKRMEEINPKWEDDRENMEKANDLGRGMLEGYYERWHDRDDFEVIATEKTLRRRIPVPGTGTLSKCYLVARLDGLVRDLNTGKLFSLEHKTFSRFTLSDLELNHQFTAQVWLGKSLAEHMGIDEPVVGVIYNGLRKQLPGPRVKRELFERHKIYRTERSIDVFLHRAYWQHREMSGNIPIFPQPNPIRCGQCDFKEVCLEYHRGGDWKFILNESFTKREEGKNGS